MSGGDRQLMITRRCASNYNGINSASEAVYTHTHTYPLYFRRKLEFAPYVSAEIIAVQVILALYTCGVGQGGLAHLTA